MIPIIIAISLYVLGCFHVRILCGDSPNSWRMFVFVFAWPWFAAWGAVMATLHSIGRAAEWSVKRLGVDDTGL